LTHKTKRRNFSWIKEAIKLIKCEETAVIKSVVQQELTENPGYLFSLILFKINAGH
jgi:hypothetical protein